MNGLESWRRVYQGFNPSAPASALTALVRIVAPSTTAICSETPARGMHDSRHSEQTMENHDHV